MICKYMVLLFFYKKYHIPISTEIFIICTFFEATINFPTISFRNNLKRLKDIIYRNAS